MAPTENVIIIGAAGRDFHDFMTYWSVQPNTVVKCFTGAQIPGIENRDFPAEMCHNDKNGNLYPNGVKIYPEDDLEQLIKRFDVTTCALAYSDLSYDTVQSLASRVNAAGCKFLQLPQTKTMLRSNKPVIAICATRTGTGKSQTTRFIAEHLKKAGRRIAVVRHPMPYDKVLLKQRCQRYETLDDLIKYDCTIEEREEYERHIEEGNLLFAGVDYEMILREAEKDADVVIWDGGNNDCPFYRPDLFICVADALRGDHANHYYPGETNVRLADIIMINKVNSLPDIKQAEDQAERLKPLLREGVPVLFGNSLVTADAKGLTEEEANERVKGKRVLVIDDGPTLTHGGMPYGAGFVLAKKLGASEIIDPRPHAKGSLVGVFEKFKHLESVLPAMGYGAEQIKDLEATVSDADCDCVVIGTPIDLGGVLKIDKPVVRTKYYLEVVPEHLKEFTNAVDSVFERVQAVAQ